MRNSLSGKSEHPKENSLQWGRMPLNVITDKSLSPLAKLVYAYISARTFQAKTVGSMGSRLIAADLGVSQTAVQKCVGKLVEAGHLKKETERGRRAIYLFTSPVFGQRQGKEKIVVRGKSGGKVLASIEHVA